MIFKIQNFNFGTLANQRMNYQEDLIKKNITEPSDRTTKRPKGQVSMRQIFVYLMVVTFGIFMNLKQKQQ